ncbi:hypothetical protein E5288_WYG003259 [Bos mutus]|uniref:Uncharacterized protein n=1 Tax=Bos mutus TaxID=72004 RepID=A0A6B0SB97_9CETA|nr:hypothetical protein [Bos mutus]
MLTRRLRAAGERAQQERARSQQNPPQKPPPHYGSCHPQNPCCHPQQVPGAQGQDSDGGECKIRKRPTETPASVSVVKKNDTLRRRIPWLWMCPLPPWPSHS